MNNNTKMLLGIACMVAATLLMYHGMYIEGGLLLATPPATLEELAGELKSKADNFSAKAKEVEDAHKELKGKMDGNEKITQSLRDEIDKLLKKHNDEYKAIRDDLEAVEQKMAARVDDDQKSAKTWGEQFTANERYVDFKKKGCAKEDRFTVELKQVTTAAAGGLIRTRREDDVVSLARERRVLRDLLRTIPTSESAIEYAVQETRVNNAAPVAEGAAKPYSDYTWGKRTVNAKVLAHLAKLTMQAMADAPRLVGEIDAEMRYGLGMLEERQFLYGNNTGEQLHGIVPQATAFVKPVGFTDPKATRIDVLRLAMLQGALALYPADGIALNITDWALIELTKDDNGQYLFSDPQGNVSARMWGLPVVPTPAMNVGEFLVGNWQMGAVVYDRMTVDVRIATENTDDFEKNLATMRAEERVAIAVKRPLCFTKGAFAAAVTSLQAA